MTDEDGFFGCSRAGSWEGRLWDRHNVQVQKGISIFIVIMGAYVFIDMVYRMSLYILV